MIAADTDQLADEFGPRFDQSAMIASVQLGSREMLAPPGMPDEFGIKGCGILGWNESASAGEFAKIGIGLLTQNHSGAYRFWEHYPLLRRFPVRIEEGPDFVAVEQEGSVRNGIGYSLRKRYSLEANGTLTLRYELANLGQGPFDFEHYNHHFLGLGSPEVSSNCSITPSFRLPDHPTPEWESRGGSLRVKTVPGHGQSIYWGVELPDQPRPFRVVVTSDDGARWEQEGAFPVSRFALWADDRTISPEVFFRYSVAPKTSVTWSSVYRFIDGR